MSSNVKISVLDLMPHRSNQSQHQTMLNTIDAARAAESYGYERFWVAEHHNAGSLLSSATVVVMAEIAPPLSVFAWVRAALCSPTTHPTWWRSSSALSTPSTPAALTWVWAVHPAPTR